MIPRYSRPQMTALWEPEAKYKIWLEIEILAAEKMAQQGTIPASVPKTLRRKGGFSIKRIEAIEREVKHDVIAFLTSVTEKAGPEARFLHQGMTSSDVLDTAFAVQLTRAADILLDDLDAVLAALKKRALQHKKTVCAGRSHGIHAEPTTFGIKLAGHYAAFVRARDRLEAARAEVATCKISGAVGTYATVSPAVESYVAKKMSLTPETVSTQVIPRDRHAFFFAVLGIIASSIENLATEIRHLQRTEVREAEEFFSAKQKGSSAMPHKRNPVLSENLTGLARIVRASVTPALENVTLWHERDISHSSVERVMAPDSCIALDFALARLAGLISQLVVYPDAMKDNLEKTGGLVFSQRVMLALTQNGMRREAAYRAVQKHAMTAWNSRGRKKFRDLLENDKNIARALGPKKLGALFDYAPYIKGADVIFSRAFGRRRT